MKLSIHSQKQRHCRTCGHVLVSSGFCSNERCKRHVPRFQRYGSPVPLLNGRKWGNWRLDAERLCLEFLTHGTVTYEIDIERIQSSAGVLDWIFQINQKSWASDKDIADLVQAFDDIFDPQQYLCSFHSEKQIGNPTEFLKRRIASSSDVNPGLIAQS
jgi:hypothetical protein